jgi:glucose/arabinose dehydrogenase
VWVGALLVLLVVARGPSAAADGCAGDCDHGGAVTVDELITGINIALGSLDLVTCPSFDVDGDGEVSVDELVAGVTHALTSCPPVSSPTPTPTALPTPTLAPPFCDLPGSVQTTADGIVVVPGADTTDLRFLHLPIGFCAHFFARVGNTRQLRFAPSGELFVASPSTFTAGGGALGNAAVMVLPDDDHDGVADAALPFLGGLPSTQGLLFVDGYFYYQDATKIMRMPYVAGDRTPSGGSEPVADISIYTSGLHWPKVLDVADDGTIYVTNGGDQEERCDPAHPFHGGVLKLDGAPGGSPVAKGFRNPISLRCVRGHNRCYAVELTKDASGTRGGREKLVPIRQDDDWGFPCCATQDVPFPEVLPVPDCSTVASDSNSFTVGDTPFDVDFESGKWPAPWTHRAFVPLHGAVGTWRGARVVSIAMDPATGEILPGSDLNGESSGAFLDFAHGWDDETRSHGRPANVVFAPDGRLFLGNDNSGDIIWIAPLDLRPADLRPASF